MVGLAVALAVTALIILGWFWFRMRQTPEWWSPADASLQENVLLGEQLENRTLSTIHTLRDGSSKDWRIVLDEEALNAWFATRWPKWAKNQEWNWAYDFRDVHAVIEAEGIHLALRPKPDAFALSLFVRPALDSSTGLSVSIEEAAVGRVSLPVDSIAEFVANEVNLDPGVSGLLAGDSIQPVFASGQDGYRVRIVEFDLEPGRLTLLCRTERDR